MYVMCYIDNGTTCLLYNYPHNTNPTQGDVVKIDMGVHVDGYIVTGAHTVVLGKESVDGKLADVVLAARHAAEIAMKSIKPGVGSKAVSNLVQAVSEAYGVSSVQGVLMHEHKRFIIDGADAVLQREDIEQRVEEFEFEVNKVYTVDVFMSSGEGKPKRGEEKATVFKRQVDVNYKPKLAAGKMIISEISKRFPVLPFNLREVGDDAKAKMGANECVKPWLAPVLQPLV